MSSASHRKTKRIEAETALELLELLFIKTVGRPGDPSGTACKKGKPGSPRPGFFNLRRNGAATSDGPAFIDFWIRVSRPPR